MTPLRLRKPSSEQQPEDAGMLSRLGHMALDQKRLADAEVHFQAVVRQQPNNVLALNNLAYVLVQQKKPGAVAMAEKAVKLAPGRAALMDTLATAYAQDKRLEQALEIQQKVLTLLPNNPNFRLNLARIQTQAGLNDAARVELTALAKIGYDYPAQAELAYLQKVVGSATGAGAKSLFSRAPSVSTGLGQQLRQAGVAIGAAFALAAGLLLLAARRPPKFSVKRSITIRAPQQQVFDLLQHLRQWENWCQWGPFAPTMTRLHIRPRPGLGALCEWHDKTKKGSGAVEIMHLVAPSLLAVEVSWSKPELRHEMSEFHLAAEYAGGTALSWVESGMAPYAMRLAATLHGGLDRRRGWRLLVSLRRLKSVAEAAAARSVAPDGDGSLATPSR